MSILGETYLDQSQLGVNQYLICQNSGANYTVHLPQPNTCNGQVINFLSKNAYLTTIQQSTQPFTYQSDGTPFFALYPNRSFMMYSDGNEWAVFDNNGSSTAIISVNQSVTYLSNRFGNNQILVLYGSANGIYLTLPDPTSCQGQVVYIYCAYNLTHYITCTGSSNFVGKGSTRGLTISNNQIFHLVSDYYNWIVVSV